MKNLCWVSPASGYSLVSIPLRGIGYEKRQGSGSLLYWSDGFPSPCGELVMKNVARPRDLNQVAAELQEGFHPLAGNWL